MRDSKNIIKEDDFKGLIRLQIRKTTKGTYKTVEKEDNYKTEENEDEYSEPIKLYKRKTPLRDSEDYRKGRRQ